MLPAMVFLILFPGISVGLGHLDFVHRRRAFGRPGQFHRDRELRVVVGRLDFSGFRCSIRCSTRRFASAIKFAIGLYLALLLNENMPFKAMLRATGADPFIRADRTIRAWRFWWIFDSQFSIISWSLKQMGLITDNINFLGDVTWARICVIFANIWRGVPFVAITLLGGPTDGVAIALRGGDA